MGSTIKTLQRISIDTESATIFRDGVEIKVYKGESGYSEAAKEQADQVAKCLEETERKEEERKRREEEASHLLALKVEEELFGKVSDASKEKKNKGTNKTRRPPLPRRPVSEKIDDKETESSPVVLDPKFVNNLRLDKLKDIMVIQSTSTKSERLRFHYLEGRDQEWPVSKIMELDVDSLKMVFDKLNFNVPRNKALSCQLHDRISRLRSERREKLRAEGIITIYERKKIHYEPEYMMEFQEANGEITLFLMNKASKVSNEFFERAIDQLDRNNEDQQKFRWGLERQLKQNKGLDKTKKRRREK